MGEIINVQIASRIIKNVNRIIPINVSLINPFEEIKIIEQFIEYI